MSNDKELRELLREQSELLDRLGASAMDFGVILCRDGKDLVVTSGNGQVRLVKDTKKNKPGDFVYLLGQTGQIWATAQVPHMGDVLAIHNVTESGDVVVVTRGEQRLLAPGSFTNLEKGDRVLVDPTHSVVVALIEKAPKPAYVPSVKPITWDDIGGHKDAKQILINAIEAPYKYPTLFKKYGKAPPKGVLLYGPPGCGKTMLGKAIATSVNGGCEIDGGFLSVKGPEILDPYVGVAEAHVRSLFERAREYKAQSGRPAVIFIDEAEAIVGHRGQWTAGGMEKTIVPAFLAEMDGLEESSAIVVLCTNRDDMLDPAVIRDGRIDHKIEIGRPEQEDAQAILGIHLKDLPLGKGLTLESTAEQVAELVYETSPPSFPHSGALLAGIVDKAKESAINRDIPTGKCSGINVDDFAMAWMQTQAQEAARPQ